MNKYVVILLALVFFTACKKETIPTVSKKDLRNLNIQDVDFEYLSTRSKINFDDGNQKIGALANIRMKKDSIIWISITPGLGIEAARGLVTQDSLFLINKLDRSYAAYSFRDLSKKLNVDVNFKILQSAILGDLILPITRENQIERKENETIILQDQGNIDIANFINNKTLKLTKVVLQDEGAKNTLTLNYEDFKSQDEKVIPFSSTISANYQNNNQLKSTIIAFKHNKAEFSSEALSFPFSIPQKYDRKY